MKDIDIAQSITLKNIKKIAQKLNISEDNIEMYGKYKAKLPLNLINEDKLKSNKLVLVTAISPTPAGEGKTTVAIGLSQGINKIGKQSTVVLREPSLGPIFGMKGGAAGGGWSQVLPMEEINLHFTGDFSAIEKANNLLAALIDNNIQSKSRTLDLDPRTITWKRVMDMNDRSLRKIIIGLGGIGQGIPRESGFDITAASEIMAILCLSNNLADLKKRIGNIFIGFTRSNLPIYARDLNAQGPMTALLKDAIKPNLVQTIEGTPAIMHGGPFANIAQGTNSVIATKMGLSLSPFVVTEAGFGADLGAEKFMDIKCQSADLKPNVVVIVATIRALKYHGGVAIKELKLPNPEAVKKGLPNLIKHIKNTQQFHVPIVVAINKFSSDTQEEINIVKLICEELKVNVAEANVWKKGGEGAIDLANIVCKIAETQESTFKPLYNWESPIKSKIKTIATKIYGADDVHYSKQALNDLKTIEKLGLSKLPVCIAKTQYSFSDDPLKLGHPQGFLFHIREITIAAGAGFVVPISGEIMRMPGLPSVPAAESIDIDEKGIISGLF